MKRLLFFLLWLPFFGKGQYLNTSLVADAPPLFFTITGAWPAFTGVAGSPGTNGGSVLINGAGLSSNLVFDASGTGGVIEISLDSSAWGTSKTIVPSGGNIVNVKVYGRIASTASVGSYSSTVPGTSSPATPHSIPYTATVTGVVAKDSIRVQFDTLTANEVAGWTHMRGDPSLSVITATGGNSNTITLSSVATDISHWNPFGASTGPNTGITTATVPNYAIGVNSEAWFNINYPFDVNLPQIIVSGLNPSSTYTVTMSGNINCTFNLNCQTMYRVKGSTLLTPISVNTYCNTPTATAQFLTVSPDGTGHLNIYVTRDLANFPATQISSISWMIIKEN